MSPAARPRSRCQRTSCRVAIVLTQPTPLALTDRAAVPMRGPEQAIHHSRSKMLAQQAGGTQQQQEQGQQEGQQQEGEQQQQEGGS